MNGVGLGSDALGVVVGTELGIRLSLDLSDVYVQPTATLSLTHQWVHRGRTHSCISVWNEYIEFEFH